MIAVAVAHWLRIWVFSMEVPGSNPGNINNKLFLHYDDCTSQISDLWSFDFAL